MKYEGAGHFPHFDRPGPLPLRSYPARAALDAAQGDRFKPAMSAAARERKLKGWARAVKGVLASDEGEG
jgi:hypothetical protein